jgi:outer membrane protein assembly factor BamB
MSARARAWIGMVGSVVVLAAATSRAVDAWPRFRGPTGDGLDRAADPPLCWSETNGVAWKVGTPGRGRSSPVLLDQRLWLTSAVEEGVRRTRIGPDDMQTAERVTLLAFCLDRVGGRILWQTTLTNIAGPDPVHWLNSWATPTPAVEPGRLYCDYGTFGTFCLEADSGRVVWQRRIALDHQVGPGSSPILDRDRLVLVRDGRDAQFVTALDTATGATVWKADRPAVQVSSPNLKKSFSTPILVQTGERRQMIVPGAHWVVSYDPETGREHWRARHGDGFSIGACPVSGQDLVFFSTGCMKAQLEAFRLDGSGDVTATHLAWKTLRQVPVMPSPVLVGAELYWVSDDGMLTCAEAQTGAVHYQERLGGAHLASPLVAGGKLYCFSQDGLTRVVRPGRTFARLAENRLEGTVVATPAVAGRSLFYRTDTHLYRLDAP